MADYAFYQSDINKTYMELYISFYQKSLTYVEEDDQFKATYKLTTQILEEDSVVSQKEKFGQSIINSLDEIEESKQFVEIFAFDLVDKEYTFKVILEDSNSNNSGDYIFTLRPKLFAGDSLMISDIELATAINRASTNSAFNKNTLQVLPNPSLTYGIDMPVLYYYAEIYNLDYNENSQGEYLVKCNVTNREDEIVKEFPEKTYKKPGNSAVLVSGYNIVTLPSDVYNLNLEIIDQQNQQVSYQSKRFNFQKPSSQPQIASVENNQLPTSSEYSWMSEADLDREFNFASYIASKTEREIYKALNTEGKRKFLSEFWARRKSPDPDASPNAYKFDYLERIQMANSNFGSGSLEGWRSDRGRILLVYGYPSEIERHYMDVDRKPYEIWLFNQIEGGVRFIFADMTGFGEFELIHSTHSQELQNPNWERLIHKAESQLQNSFNDF
jgi:GWxTD domain-containing protein